MYLGECIKADNSSLIIILEIARLQSLNKLFHSIATRRVFGLDLLAKAWWDVFAFLKDEIRIVFANDDVKFDTDFVDLSLAHFGGSESAWILSNGDSV
jgi:hypothetical protein